MIDPKCLRKACLNMLKPYRMPPGSPYPSEDQCELSALSLQQRASWMAEWIFLAKGYKTIRKQIIIKPHWTKYWNLIQLKTCSSSDFLYNLMV